MTIRRLEGILRTIAALAAIAVLAPVPRAAAAKIDITPSITLDQVYDTNVFNTSSNEKGDFIFRVTPAVVFSIGMTETTLSMRTSISSDTYYKYSQLNSTNSAISLAVTATPIRITPRFSVAPSAHYIQAKSSYLRDQLLPPADPLLPPPDPLLVDTTAMENQNLESREYGGALRVIYQLTDQSELSIGGGFSKLHFLDNVAGGAVDSRSVTGDTALTYRFTPLLSAGPFFSAADTSFANGRDSRIYSAGLTGTYLFSQELTLTARAGASRSTETGLSGISDNTTWSPTASLALTYAKVDFTATLTGTVDQSGGGSFGRTTRRNTVGLTLHDRFAEGWTADLSGSYQQSRSLDTAVSEDLTSATGMASVGYQPWSWVTFHLTGTAFRQWSNGSVGADLARYSAFVGVTLSDTFNVY